MLTLSFFIFCAVFAFLFFGFRKSKGCESGMRMINADWMEQDEKFKLISRWGVKW